MPIGFILTQKPRGTQERVPLAPNAREAFATYSDARDAWHLVDPHKNRPENIQIRPVYKVSATLSFMLVPTHAASLACAVLAWAETPGQHGGNPYCKEFVQMARKILGDE